MCIENNNTIANDISSYNDDNTITHTYMPFWVNTLEMG